MTFCGRLAFAVTVLLTAFLASAQAITDRMSLVEAIEAVRAEGIEVVYSSRLVEPWMRVRETPETEDAIEALDQALAHYRLDLVEGPDGRWLVVEGEAEAAAAGFTIRGRVSDAATGDVLQGASIHSAKQITQSLADGSFELRLASASDLAVRADGYVTARRRIDHQSNDLFLDVSLEPVALPAIDEVLIIASRYSMFDRRGVPDQFLTADDIQLMPHLADDAFRAFHRLPGAAASDFQAPFHLRGGAHDEIKVQLDGLELFEPYHMKSLFSPLSIIDPGIIGNAQVYSGGFTVDHGNYTSGVIDISSALPDHAPVHQLGISFVNAFARSAGEFDSGRGAYQLSARRGYLDLIADQLVDPGEELNPRYGDLFAKISYLANDYLEVTGHLLLAEDDVRFVDPGDGEDFGEDGSLRYGWLVLDYDSLDRVRWKNMLFAGRVETTEEGQQINPPAEHILRFYSREFDVTGVQSDLEFKLSDTRMFRVGARYRHLEGSFDYRLDSTRQWDFANNGQPFTLLRNLQAERDGDEIGTYAAYRFQLFDKLTVEAGLRWDKQTYGDTPDDSQTDVRFNGLYHLGKRTDLRFSWGRFHQPQGIENLQLPDGVTQYFPAEQAEHRVLGLRHRFLTGLELQADLYEKRYSELRPRFENVLDFYEYAGESNFDRVRVQPDNARAYGLELTLRQPRAEKLDWWLNYTWATAEDRFAGIDVPRSWDQRHALTANLTWRGDKWTVSAIGRYHSGWPKTPLIVLPTIDGLGNLVAIDSDLTRRNESQYDDYSRLDLRISRTVDLDRGNFEYYLEIFNVFDTENQCCTSNHELTINPIAATPTIDNYMPLFPSFGFVWTFGPGAD